MADIVQIRRDTAANWTSANPTLANGEQGYETDTKKMKVGDGSTAWTSLDYFAGGAGSSTWVELTDTPASITSLQLVRGNSGATALEQIAQSTLLLDNFGVPENNADLNATIGHHGLLPILGGGTANYLRADGTWAEPSGAGSGLPVVDTTSIVTGSVDATKQMRFEVDGLTTSTTRVLTVQDKDVTICDNADLTTHTGGANPHSGSAASGANSDITSLSGLTTDLSISQGGTGQSTAQAAMDALSQVSGATNEHVLTKDTGTGNATWKASGGGVTDHGALTGLTDDDHTQYLLVDGTRSMGGDLLPDGSANRDFGSSTSPWRDAHIDGVIYMQQSSGSDISGCHDIISPTGITMGIQSNGPTLDLECGSGGYVRLSGSPKYMAPLWDNDHDLGLSDHRWKNIYGVNGIFNTLSFEKLSLGSPTELTISGGIVTSTKSYHKIDTEADAATDDLDTINGGVVGDILIISPMSDDRTIVVKNSAFNGIYLSGSDFTMDSENDMLTLLCTSTNAWTETSRSDNGV